MGGTVKSYWIEFIKSPEWRAATNVATTVVGGVLSGGFIVEITTGSGRLVWAQFYESVSFWCLLILSIILFLYHRSLLTYESDVMRFSDEEYCIAYMRAQCLPEAAEQYKRRIKEGGERELQKTMDDLKRALR